MSAPTASCIPPLAPEHHPPLLHVRLRQLMVLLALALAAAWIASLANGLRPLAAWEPDAAWLWCSHLGLLTGAAGVAAWRERRLRQRLRELKARLEAAALNPVSTAAEAAMVHAQARRLALDLHDGAIQPYIGLKLALEGLRLQAGAGHPLEAGLQRVLAMTETVIQDLRRCTQRLTQAAPTPSHCLRTELEQQAQQMRQFHGLEITVEAAKAWPLSARLQEEVCLLVREGLSNIRRHTQARSAEVRVERHAGWLGIRIANEAAPGTRAFTPRSITERAQALGGRVLVCTQANGQTDVRVRLPV